jgi:flagellar hook-length control protein FliK
MTGAIDNVVSSLTFESSQTDIKKSNDINAGDEEFSEVFKQANAKEESDLSDPQSDSAYSDDDSDSPTEINRIEHSEVAASDESDGEQTLSLEIEATNIDVSTLDRNFIENDSVLAQGGIIKPAQSVLSNVIFDPLKTGLTANTEGHLPNTGLLSAEQKLPLTNITSSNVQLTASADLTSTPNVLNNNLGLSALSATNDSIVTNISLDSFDDAQKLIKSAVNELANVAGKSDAITGLSTPLYTERTTALTSTALVASLPVAHTGWGEQVGQKVLWMASQGLSEAEIQLDPPELGPLQAKVTINNEQAQVTFNSHSSQVRDALEQTVTRLRELFSNEGIDLVDVNVSDNPGQQQSQNSDVQERESIDHEEPIVDEYNPETARLNVHSSSNYIVDDYI